MCFLPLFSFALPFWATMQHVFVAMAASLRYFVKCITRNHFVSRQQNGNRLLWQGFMLRGIVRRASGTDVRQTIDWLWLHFRDAGSFLLLTPLNKEMQYSLPVLLITSFNLSRNHEPCWRSLKLCANSGSKFFKYFNFFPQSSISLFPYCRHISRAA